MAFQKHKCVGVGVGVCTCVYVYVCCECVCVQHPLLIFSGFTNKITIFERS